jgi:hypothetical protein
MMGEACSTRGEYEKWYKVLVGKSERNRPLWRPRRKWEDDIKMNLEKMVYEGVGLI